MARMLRPKSKRWLVILVTMAWRAAVMGQGKTSPATAPTIAPPLEKAGWELTFHDEFDGDKLDETKWTDRYYNGRTHGNGELEYYAPDGYQVNDGHLRLIAQKRDMGGKHYTSGMIEGSGKFSQKYGWFEIRCKVPSGKSYWPAFWLLPATRKWPPEVDIMEILGHEPTITHMTTHEFDARRRELGDTHAWTGPDFSADFHTFACDWEPGVIDFYVDGVLRHRCVKAVPAEPMYIVANLAVGGDWPGNPDAKTVFPGYMEIDYIRVYQKKTGK